VFSGQHWFFSRRIFFPPGQDGVGAVVKQVFSRQLPSGPSHLKLTVVVTLFLMLLYENQGAYVT